MNGFFLNCIIAVGAFCLYFGVQMVLSLAMTLVGESACLLRTPNASIDQVFDFCDRFVTGHQCFALIFAALFTFTILWGYFKARAIDPAKELCAGKVTLGHTLLFMFIGVILNFVVGIVISLIPWPEAWLSVYETQSSQLLETEGFAMRFIAIVLAAPVMEEVIFRGMMQTYLSRAMPAWLAAAIQCIIFGVIHGTPLWMCYTFMLGILFTVCNKKTETLWTGIVMHIGFNLFAMLPT